jgi:hypothetical protein
MMGVGGVIDEPNIEHCACTRSERAAMLAVPLMTIKRIRALTRENELFDLRYAQVEATPDQ